MSVSYPSPPLTPPLPVPASSFQGGWITLNGDVIEIPEVQLQYPSPRIVEYPANSGNLSSGSSLNKHDHDGNKLQLPQLSNVTSLRHVSCSSVGGASGSQANSAEVTVSSEFTVDREQDFDEGDTSIYNKTLSNLKRKAGISDVLEIRMMSGTCTPSQELSTDDGHVMETTVVPEDEALLEEEDQQWMQRLFQLRCRQLEMLAQLRSTAMSQGNGIFHTSHIPLADQHRQYPKPSHSRPQWSLRDKFYLLTGCCSREEEVHDEGKEIEMLVSQWEVFRGAVVKAYGPNSFTWPEEIKYTYAVCFNRIVGQANGNHIAHPAFPTTVPFDLSSFDKGSLRTSAYDRPKLPSSKKQRFRTSGRNGGNKFFGNGLANRSNGPEF